jgi:hypothetical protein
MGINTTGGHENQVFDNSFSCTLAGAGGWAVLNSGAATDAWINNHCSNGMAIATP